MTKQNKEQTKEKIKTWLNEKLKLDFREFENENFHFSYLVWARKEGSKMGSKTDIRNLKLLFRKGIFSECRYLRKKPVLLRSCYQQITS